MSFEPDFSKSENGLIVAIAQDVSTGEILMQAFMNRQAWQETLRSGYAVYWSRSRNKLWKKGETSGNQQVVQQILVDCDADTVILKVKQQGGIACHNGYRSCFYRQINKDGELEVIDVPVKNPKDIYS